MTARLSTRGDIRGATTAYLALALIGIATLAIGAKAQVWRQSARATHGDAHLRRCASTLPASLDVIHAGDGLAADSTGNLYVGYERSDLSEHVAVFDSQGHFIRDWEVEHPANSHVPKVAVGGPDGLVYVLPSADPETIKIYKPDGTFVRQFAAGSVATEAETSRSTQAATST